MKRVYIAGPMSGLPQFNFPAFYAAAAALREQGYEVISPAELDDAEDKGAAMASPDGDPASAKRTWGDFLARDVKLLADGVERYVDNDGNPPVLTRLHIDGIVFLPDWQKSKGAKLEAFVGVLAGKEFATYDPETGAVMSRALGWALHQIAAQYPIDMAEFARIYAPLPGAK